MSQFCRSEAHHGMASFSSLGLTRPKSRCWSGWAFIWRFWGRRLLQAHLGFGRIWFYAFVGQKSLFPCWLMARSHSQFLEAPTFFGSWPPPYSKPSMACRMLQISLPPSSASLKGSCGYTEPTRMAQNHVPILRSFD